MQRRQDLLDTILGSSYASLVPKINSAESTNELVEVAKLIIQECRKNEGVTLNNLNNDTNPDFYIYMKITGLFPEVLKGHHSRRFTRDCIKSI